MCTNGTSDPAVSRSSHAGGRARQARRTLCLAAVAIVSVLGPGAYAASAGAAAHASTAARAVAAKKHKPKPKKCKKGFVLRHGRCVAKSKPPVY
jgi:hypothetical protein